MPNPIEIRVDASQLELIEKKLGALSNRTDDVLRRALNRTGDMAFTQVKRAIARQMGMKVGDAAKSLTTRKASYAALRYSINAAGPYLPLKYFGARQLKKGVAATPWAVRRVFPHTFIVSSLGGHVFERSGKRVRMTKGIFKGRKRQRLRKLWGPALPNELVKCETAKAFTDTVATVLPRRIEHELARALGT